MPCIYAASIILPVYFCTIYRIAIFHPKVKNESEITLFVTASTQNVSDQAWLILYQCKCISIPYVMLPQLLYISIMAKSYKRPHLLCDKWFHFFTLYCPINSGSPSWLLKQRCLWQGCCLSLPCYCTCPARFVYFLTETVQ